MRRITLNGGPLDGRTFDVPDSASVVDHLAAVGGCYDSDGLWTPDPAPLSDAELGEFVSGLAEFLGAGIPRLVREARMGRRVAIVAKTRKRAVELWSEALPEATDALKVRRANGSERITFSTGGILVPIGLNSTGGRGLALDTLYVDAAEGDVDLVEVVPCLATSAEPSVLWAGR